MGSQFWFLTDGMEILAVYTDMHSAEAKLQMYKDDPDFEYYTIYDINVSELPDHPEEYQYASGRGLV